MSPACPVKIPSPHSPRRARASRQLPLLPLLLPPPLLLLLLLRAPGLLASPSPPPLLAAEEAVLRAAVAEAFGLAPSYGESCAPCARGDNVGALVRLAFHDAAGRSAVPGAGGAGPNGCIDDSEPANAGLVAVRATLEAVRTAFGPQRVSRADLWVLAAAHATQLASTAANFSQVRSSGLPFLSAPLALPVRYGRGDDASCAGFDAGRLPSPSNSWAATVSRFGEFGMSAQHVTALLGAHTLGRCERANSGIEGGWTATQSSFSNAFFALYFFVPWRHNESDPSPDVWDSTANAADGSGRQVPVILLRSDVELGLATAADDGSAANGTCDAFDLQTAPAVCPHRLGLDLIVRYANFSGGTELWFADYAPAWRLMTEFGYAEDPASPGGNALVPAASAAPAAGAASSPATGLDAPTGAALGGVFGGFLLGFALARCRFGARGSGADGAGPLAPLVGGARGYGAL